MSTVNSSNGVQDKWSDPLIQLQVHKFQVHVKSLSESGVPSAEVVKVSEFLCDWSRNLLNRAFGRTNDEEMVVIAILFQETANQIKSWAKTVGDEGDLARIKSYAHHISERAGIVES